MQHLLNLKHLESYSFYNPEMDSPDFMRATKTDLPEEVHFEVVGSRGVLGERQRSQRVSEVTAFLLSNPLTQDIPDTRKLSILAYQDAGLKNPEYYLNNQDGEDPKVAQIKMQAEEAIQQLQQECSKLKEDLAIAKSVNFARVEEAKVVAETRGEVEQFKAERQMEVVQFKAEQEALIDKFNAQLKASEDGRKADMHMLKASLDQLKAGREVEREDRTMNVIDSSAARPLETIGQAISQMAEAIKNNNEVLNNVVQTISKPRDIKLNRDANGRPVGATSTVQ